MDPAHDWTDGQIEDLTRRFRKVYGAAEREMRGTLDDFMGDFFKKDAEWADAVASGAETQAAHDAWRRAQAVRRDYLVGMVDRLSTDATRANQKALDMVNERIPTVYAENANFGAYQVESGLGFDTHSFDLYDESTVRRLMATTEHDQLIHEVIPVGPARPDLQSLRIDLDAAKDVQWNRQKFTAAVTQSILQGESIPHAAKRLMGVLNMDRAMATRAARTAMTSAENAGRVDSYKRAKAMGISLEQEWMATLDERTRHSHRQLDGQHVPVGEKFEVEGHEIEFPGDPKAHPSETYNCRCTLVAWLPGIEKEDPERWSRLPKGMSYDEWKDAKSGAIAPTGGGVVDGKDILGTWSRRMDQFDYAIDDVIDAQGFNGLPRVVEPKEFDALVKQANNGDGFVMQRVYSAPNKETLDQFREQLYRGEWYVNCANSDFTFGRGMYAASDLSGTVTDGLKGEIQYYAHAYERDGGKVSYVETMTLDSSARTVRYEDLLEKKGNYRQEVLDWDSKWNSQVRDAYRNGEFGEEAFDEMKERHRLEYAKRIEQAQQVASMDEGAYAAAMGYDAIIADAGQSGSYTVVLNRTKLIIRRP